MLEFPVSQYGTLIKQLEGVTINTLFALSVLENHVRGEVFVDSLIKPSTFYVNHPYGMSLLFGKTTNHSFNENLKAYLENKLGKRKKVEWLQVFPLREWEAVLANLLGDTLVTHPHDGCSDTAKILCYKRINFQFSKESYYAKKPHYSMSSCRIEKTSRELFERMNGSVVPKYFWNSVEEFEAKGIGFSLMDSHGVLLATAFASFIVGNKLELGIETNENYRGKGYAYAVSARLIDFCLEHAFEPIWACSSINLGSQKLAEKLGFHIVREIPYYKLPFQTVVEER